MVIWQVIVTDGGDFDAVRFNALYRSETRAREVAPVELAKARKRYAGDDMESRFAAQVEANIIRRNVI